MRFNQYSYLALSRDEIYQDFQSYGFPFHINLSEKELLEHFLRHIFFTYQHTDYLLASLAADKETDLLTFFQSRRELTEDIFYTIAFQVLGFSYLVDF